MFAYRLGDWHEGKSCFCCLEAFDVLIRCVLFRNLVARRWQRLGIYYKNVVLKLSVIRRNLVYYVAA